MYIKYIVPGQFAMLIMNLEQRESHKSSIHFFSLYNTIHTENVQLDFESNFVYLSLIVKTLTSAWLIVLCRDREYAVWQRSDPNKILLLVH